MSQNPYDSPQEISHAPDTAEASPDAARRKRPIGVSLLAGFLFVVGLLSLASGVYAIGRSVNLSVEATDLAVPLYVLWGLMLFLTALLVVIGVGLWLGTKWGWWLAAFNYIYGIVDSVATVVSTYTLPPLPNVPASAQFIAGGVQIVVSALICLYLFKRNVLAYFRLPTLDKTRALVILSALAIAITVVTIALGVQQAI